MSKSNRGMSVLGRALGIGLLAAVAACATQNPPPEPQNVRPPIQEDPGLSDTPDTTTGTDDLRGSFRTIYFDFDDSSLKPAAKDALRFNARLLAQNPNARLEVQGHCDERGSEEYNLALGKRRAESAKRYLMDLGVESRRLNTVSFGEEKPAVMGHTEAAWAKNRRSEFVLR